MEMVDRDRWSKGRTGTASLSLSRHQSLFGRAPQKNSFSEETNQKSRHGLAFFVEASGGRLSPLADAADSFLVETIEVH